jgi:threonine aldolase
MYGEAVVYLDRTLASSAPFVRKQVGQLPSKMRYVAAQFNGLLHDGLWLANGGHANAMARRLYGAVAALDSLELRREPDVNSVFPLLTPEQFGELSAWCPFYEWDPARNQVRWMTAWDTTPDDVDRFAAGVRRVVAPEQG